MQRPSSKNVTAEKSGDFTVRRFGNYFCKNDENLAEQNRQRRELLINNCVQMVTRNNNQINFQSGNDLTNLILDNYTFQQAHPVSKQEMEYFLMDPINSRAVIEKANEQLSRPQTTKSHGLRKIRVQQDAREQLPVSSPKSDLDEDWQLDKSNTSSIKKSKQTFNQKASYSRKTSFHGSPDRTTGFVFSPTSASAFNSDNQNQHDLSRTMPRMGFKTQNLDKLFVTERLHEDQKYFRLTSSKLT